MRFARLAIPLLAAALVACVTTPTERCGDLVCPESTVCVLAAGGCFAPADVDACTDKADGDTCTTGTITGSCANGVCSSTVCGDGIVADGEVCDDGNIVPDDSCATDCRQANCLVPTTHASVQSAIDDDACPVVYVLPGTYSENLMTARDVTIESVGAGDVVLDGSRAGPVLVTRSGDSVSLRGVTVSGGLSSSCGGGVLSDGTLVLDEVTVTGNESEEAGGGICHGQFGSLLIFDSTIDANVVSGTLGGLGRASGGGGIYTRGTVIAIGVRVTNNEVTSADRGAAGGGIYVEDGSVELGGGCEVSGNTARIDGNPAAQATGGGISGDRASITASRCTFIGNTVSSSSTEPTSIAYGGAIALDIGTLALSETSFSQNSAISTGAGGAVGGAISTTEGTLNLSDSEFTNNSASSAAISIGGGLSLQVTGTAAIRDLDIIDNSALAPAGDALGGGLALIGIFTGAELSGLRVEGNAAMGATGNAFPLAGGGGMVLYGINEGIFEGRVVRSTFSGNQTDGFGGGVHLISIFFSEPNVAIENSTISGNSAANGGGFSSFAVQSQRTQLRLVNSTVTGNTATVAGGGMFLTEQLATNLDFETRNSIIAANSAVTDADCSSATIPIASDLTLWGSLTECTLVGAGNLEGDPMLGPLTDNGGRTATHSPLAGSPVIDADGAQCEDTDASAIDVDQRSLPRDLSCDLGAVELQ